MSADLRHDLEEYVKQHFGNVLYVAEKAEAIAQKACTQADAAMSLAQSNALTLGRHDGALSLIGRIFKDDESVERVHMLLNKAEDFFRERTKTYQTIRYSFIGSFCTGFAIVVWKGCEYFIQHAGH